MIEQRPVTEVEDWWVAEDMPMRVGTRACFLIDGRMTMLEMCRHFLSAKRTIYIAAWGITPEMLLVRGKHHRAGPNGSPEQEELLNWLRSKDLSDEDLRFWVQSEKLSVLNVLSYAVSKGVDVRILLWDSYTLLTMPDAKQAREVFEPYGIYCQPDDSHKSILNHPLAALHQKTAVIDGRYAFVGGIDMMMENGGDYDRWDTKGHFCQNPLRLGKDGFMPHSWHDVHVMFEGPAVADVEQNFRQRWNAVVKQHESDPLLAIPEPLPGEPAHEHTVGELRMQVVRTIPDRIYEFAPDGIATILDSYTRAFAHAKHSIYIENQYFWRRTFFGLENPVRGPPHTAMERLLQTLAEALTRGVSVMLVLPDNPNFGREFTDDGLKYLWEQAPQAVSMGTLQAYTLATCEERDGEMRYRPIYVHGKVAVVDDEWITVGSANINHRGMYDDAELNIAILHHKMAQGLRILLMAEHLGLADEDTLFRIIEVMGRVRLTNEMESMSGDLANLWAELQERLQNPFAGMALFAQQARKNLLAVKERRPLVGHLLPYIRHDIAEEYEIDINPVNGWLDTPPVP
jgi:phosphatidylserine/phosphatidylglycerophosphate/cardiolipin synthase-like enzyme